MSSYSSIIKLSHFPLKGKHNDCLGNGNLMIYKIRFKKSNRFGCPLPHSASAGQNRGYLQRGSQDLLTQKQASGFSLLHIASFTTGLITSMNLADERWFFSYESLKSLHLLTTLDVCWLQGESVTKNKMFWFPSHRTLAFLFPLCNVQLGIEVSTFTISSTAHQMPIRAGIFITTYSCFKRQIIVCVVLTDLKATAC